MPTREKRSDTVEQVSFSMFLGLPKMAATVKPKHAPNMWKMMVPPQSMMLRMCVKNTCLVAQ